MVGSANGRSMIALTTLCPQKRSRTRIHATIVPKTALIRQTPTEMTSVSLSAAIACGSVTASQKPIRPAWPACQTSAASGSRTIRLRYAVTNDTPSHGPGLGTAAGRGRLSARALSSAPVAPLDLRHDPVARVEELLVHLRPAAEPLDREHTRRIGEAESLRRAAHHRAVAVLGPDHLGGLRAQEVDERPGRGPVRARLDGGDRVRDLDRRLRHHEVDRLVVLLREDRLVLVREEHVSAAGEERL